RQALWRFTKRLHDDGSTILLTTHYLEEAEALCEEIAILNRGEVVALDSKQGLLSRCPYRTLHLTVDKAVGKLKGLLPEYLQSLLVETQDNDISFRLHKTEHQIGDVLEALKNSGLNVVDLYTEEAGLEEVFLGLTESAPEVATEVAG
ncbi:MAG: ABC transporter ATP-binding protein, partial [Gammaproteobacteria bacterium]|nr:ABC transporter ATP-binding protein [Gammaproteobacteria bacterium]